MTGIKCNSLYLLTGYEWNSNFIIPRGATIDLRRSQRQSCNRTDHKLTSVNSEIIA